MMDIQDSVVLKKIQTGYRRGVHSTVYTTALETLLDHTGDVTFNDISFFLNILMSNVYGGQVNSSVTTRPGAFSKIFSPKSPLRSTIHEMQ